jgi:hypothetical protein
MCKPEVLLQSLVARPGHVLEYMESLSLQYRFIICEDKLKEFPERDLPSLAQSKKWVTAPEDWLRKVGNTAQLWGHLNKK